MSRNNLAFRPAWWLPGPHLPTIWAALRRRGGHISWRHERLTFPDGDTSFLSFVEDDTKDLADDVPLVIALHGLEGDYKSNYIRGLMNAVNSNGWRGVLLHFRGCYNGPNRLDRSYHSGDTGDFKYALQHLANRFPRAQRYAVGYSLGGNVLLKYLGETGGAAELSAAVAVSVPFELNKAADRLNQGFSRLYQRRLLESLKAKYAEKFRDRAGPVSLESLASLDTFWHYDDAVTAPLHGFKNVHDYYRNSSCRQFLPDIKKPTLVIHAQDDPFVPAAAIPDVAEVSGYVALQITNTGGHVGFVGRGGPLTPDYWLDRRIATWLTTIHASDEKPS